MTPGQYSVIVISVANPQPGNAQLTLIFVAPFTDFSKELAMFS